MRSTPLRISLLLCVYTVCGCASPWERFYKPNPAAIAAHIATPATPFAEVRTIEYPRFQAFVSGERDRRTKSSIAPQDLSYAEKLAAKNRFLETMQLHERGDEVTIIGFSEFTFPGVLNPADGALQRFSEKVGAHYVVVTSAYAGRTIETAFVPITTYSESSATANAYGTSGYLGTATATGTESSTTWVPTQVPRDHWIYHCIFLRKMSPGAANLSERLGP